MALSSMSCRAAIAHVRGTTLFSRRWLASNAAPALTKSTATSPSTPARAQRNTHYRITLKRSAIGLTESVKQTLVAMGIRRRLQTVYHRHTPEMAGKILTVKELVEVQNVPRTAVRTQEEQRKERKAVRGFTVVRSLLPGAE